MNITDFLLARIAEDEEAAHNAAEGPWATWRINGTKGLGVYSVPRLEGNRGVVEIADRRGHDSYAHYDSTDEMDPGDARHISRWNPARVLAECEAKRRILEHAQLWERTLNESSAKYTDVQCAMYRMAMHWTLERIVQPYADHPDFEDMWRD